MEQSRRVLWTSWCLLFIAIMFYCLDFFFRISPSLVVDQLLRQYSVTAVGAASFATFFYIGYVLFQIPAGVIFDNRNPRLVFVVSLLVCAICFWGFVVGRNEEFGFLMRFLIGAGSAFSFIGALYIADSYISRKYFSLIVGVVISLGTIAASGAQFISAYLFKFYNWHVVFVCVSIIALLLGSILLLMPDSNRLPQSRINYSLKAYFGIIRRIFSDRKLLINALIGGLFYLPTSIFGGLWGISFLHVQYHLTEEKSSLAIMLLFLGWAIGAPLIGLLASRVHRDRLLIMFGAALALVTAVLLLYFPNIVAGHLLFVVFLFGIASSCQVVVWSVFSRFGIDSASGFAIAATNMIIMLLAALFHLIVGFSMNLSDGVLTSKYHLIYTLAAYHHALLIMPLAFGFVVMLILIRF